MKTVGISKQEWQASIEERLEKLESERVPVRSDGVVSPPQSDAPEAQDRPISPDVGRLVNMAEAYVEWTVSAEADQVFAIFTRKQLEETTDAADIVASCFRAGYQAGRLSNNEPPAVANDDNAETNLSKVEVNMPPLTRRTLRE